MRKAVASLLLILCTIAASLPFAVPASATTIVGINPNSGRVGQSISVTGLVNYPGDRFELYWNSADKANLLVSGATVTSAASVDFIVPEAPRGKYTVILFDLDDQTQATGTFTVLPSFSATPESGTAGTRVTVSGKGFAAGETGIRVTWDGAEIGVVATANEKGSWTTTIDAPASARGEHILGAYGAISPAAETGTDSFGINPQMFVSPAAISAGAAINISGAGFAALESGITVLVDDSPVKSDIVADAKGSWSYAYTVPAGTSKGTHTVASRGAVTIQPEVTPATFNIAPNFRITPASGTVGTKVTVTGAGFVPNETIGVTYDGFLLVEDVAVDANGAWTASLEAPAGIRGRHSIRAAGTSTPGGDIAALTFTITPRISASPLTGAIGTEVTVTGEGFDAVKQATVTYDGETVAQGNTSREGSFEFKFKIPKGKSGPHTLVVKDTAGDLQAIFAMETQAPAAPQLEVPESGVAMNNREPEFEWAPVSDPSGVTYSFELSSNQDMSKPIISRSGLTETTLKLTTKEALESGAYYWRVRATDGAENQGAWSTTQTFTIGTPFPLWALIAIIVGGVAIVAGLAIWLIRRRMYDF